MTFLHDLHDRIIPGIAILAAGQILGWLSAPYCGMAFRFWNEGFSL
ncbi:MAG: hypothetical protein KGL39_32460 [Patescibacteria group bacterium]|nr:hypothetical protein [Patescibacteria group bacterium]